MAGSDLPKGLRLIIGLQVRAHRKGLQLTQEELAARVGVNTSQVCRIEKGQSSGSLCTILRMAWAMQVHPSRILPDLEDVNIAFGKAP